MKPRVIFTGRMRYALPLSESLRLKWDAIGKELDFRVVASGAGADDERFRLRPRTALDGPRFWLSLPWRLHRESRRFRPAAIVAQSPYEGAAALVARTGVPVIVEVHGDWRTFTRLYGSPWRRVLGRLGDRVALWAVRRAAKVRTVSPYTASLVQATGRDPAASFPAYMDLRVFAAPPAPLPARATALFVGVLERYKNFDGLAEAWRRAHPRVPAAALHIVGDGTLADVAEALVADGLATWDRRLEPSGVAAAMDEAGVVVLPSRSEGMGRVVIEAFLRGRPVLGARLGGIRDLVTDDVDGMLVDPDPASIADALVRLLGDRELLQRLAAGARAAGERWLIGPDDYARAMRELVVGS